ncbi:Dipeptidyl peptidase IV [Actinobacteria bacterium OV450]|nr:Dipeptidyl peptidase IV [Actinobacteria bacterium OV450]
MPGAEHTLLDRPAHVRVRCRDFPVRELMGTRPPGHRPAPTGTGPQTLAQPPR